MKISKQGRPPLTKIEQETVVRKVEPYLKAGLSIRKACVQSGVSRTTLYKIMDERPELANQIAQFQSYLEILTMGSITKELLAIVQKQNSGIELDAIDLRFLMWFATHSNHCRDEFGREKSGNTAYDPHVELLKLMRLIDDFSTCEAFIRP